MRLFTAIDLPEEMLEKLGAFVERLRPLANLRWTGKENLHITTKFIGEWPEVRIEDMKTALREVKSPGPIRISVRGVGWFPEVKRPRVFWAGVDAGEPLARLANATEQTAAQFGVPVEERVYSPHLTLARLKDRVRLDDLLAAVGDPDFGAFQARSFVLYLSSPLPAGRGSVPDAGLPTRYSKLAEFPFHS